MRGAPRAGKVVAHRLLGERGYAAVQTRYWRRRVRRLRYPFEFREEIEAAVKPGDTVVDVGANVGQYTALLSRLVGPTGRVLAFEPDPRTHAMLESIVRGLGLVNVETFEIALADAAGTMPIARVLDEDGLPNLGLTHLASCGEAPFDEVRVEPLDSVCAAVEVCTFVKVDVEGAELAVLRGGATCLATRRPLLMVEVDAGMSARYGSSPEQVVAFLAGLSYELWKPQISEWRGGSGLFRPV